MMCQRHGFQAPRGGRDRARRGDGVSILGIMLGAGVALSMGCAAADGASRVISDRRDAGDDSSPAAGQDGGDALSPSGDAGAAASLDSSNSFGLDGSSSNGLDGSAPILGETRCLDLQDDNLNGLIDCAERSCSAEPLCCVNRVSDACCSEGALRTFDFASCAERGESVRQCDPELQLFGSPEPYLGTFGMVPNGDRGESGILIGAAVNPSAISVTLSARIHLEAACVDCKDDLSFGLTRTEPARANLEVLIPEVGIVFARELRLIRLISGGEVLTDAPFESLERLGDLDVVIRTTTDGRVDVTVNEITLFEDRRFAPLPNVYPYASGRSLNRTDGSEEPIQLRSLTVSTRRCDTPHASEREAEPILPDSVDGWWTSGARVRAPSTLDASDGSALVAFVVEDRIHLGANTARAGRFRALSDPRLAASAVVPDPSWPVESWWSSRVDEPELVVEDDGRRAIYFSAYDSAGNSSIGRSVERDGAPLEFGPPTQVLQPDVANGILGWDGPSLSRVTLASGDARWLVARRRSTRGTSLVVLSKSDAGWTPTDLVFLAGPGQLERDTSLLSTPRLDDGYFDDDEVAAPALIQYRGVLRLYYAGRRGTRWSVGALLSQDGLHWLRSGGGRVIVAGSGADHDSFSASDPEPRLLGDELYLYYTASNGVRDTIGMASTSIPGGPS